MSDLTGKKRGRDDENGIEEETKTEEEKKIEPPEKKRKVEEVEDDIMEELFNFFAQFFQSSQLQLTLVRTKENLTMQEKLHEILEIVKKDPRAIQSQSVRKMIFFVEYYRHEVNSFQLGSALSDANNGNFRRIESFFVDKIRPMVEEPAFEFFQKQLVRDAGKTAYTNESMRTAFNQNNQRHGKVMTEYINGMVNELLKIDSTHPSQLRSPQKPAPGFKKISSQSGTLVNRSSGIPSSLSKIQQKLQTSLKKDGNNNINNNNPNNASSPQQQQLQQQTGENVQVSGDYMNVKIIDQDNNAVYFKVHRSTQFKKLIKAYYDNLRKLEPKVQDGAFRFFYGFGGTSMKGRIVESEKTIEQAGMKEMDHLNVLPAQ